MRCYAIDGEIYWCMDGSAGGVYSEAFSFRLFLCLCFRSAQRHLPASRLFEMLSTRDPLVSLILSNNAKQRRLKSMFCERGPMTLKLIEAKIGSSLTSWQSIIGR